MIFLFKWLDKKTFHFLLRSYPLSIFNFLFIKCSSFLTGKISPSQWALAMESVLHLDLPWRTLRPRLVHLAQEGNVEYLSSFDALEIEIPIKEVRYLKVHLVSFKIPCLNRMLLNYM